MSRRPNVAPDRAEHNRATLKSFAKLDLNKTCADCKRNKHPRWASWNLGIFICIRCSGIHRGMGTHISKVKSVDLDSWTDEQTQTMLRWGNTRANKYWESKLSQGHLPAEAKIENFIRTKYDTKRWVMDGGIPDPSTLTTDGDDDVPLNVVQEKAKLERSTSQKASSQQPARKPAAEQIDLFADDSMSSPPPRPSTTGPAVGQFQPAKASPALPKQTKPGESLLGLDFFGGPPSSTTPSSASAATAAPAAGVPSRPDLKQSILSLYSSAPKSAPPQQARPEVNAFGGGPQSQSPPPQQNALGGMNDAFSGLTFGSGPAPPQSSSAFGDLDMSQKPTPSATPAFGSGGNFFSSAKPSQSAQPIAPPAVAPQRSMTNNSGFGDFSFNAPTSPQNPQPPAAASGDLFDLSMPSSTSQPPQHASISSPFNLSSAPIQQPASFGQPAAANSAPKPAPVSYSNMDDWGSNDAWATGTTSTATASSATKTQQPISPPVNSNDFAWGSPAIPQPQSASQPKVAADEDFGGWTTSAPSTGAAAGGSQQTKPNSGFSGAGDDLFSNVWE